MKSKTMVRRCAVYTRKSSEEGLEQDFNSLHAQREACEAFIRSQRGEGWRLVETAYDDGGLSGGTMERPALKRLLADIARQRVDTVVVYKVDRLTRSLMDFSKIVELFDRHGVSFVAVTQQFNTTTSMGRLTLNILLSFAQFEREVTGERIRDKIAASKKKGMWMGGVTPLGYAVRDRKLVIIPGEAETVRLIYRRYRELGSVRLLQQDLDRQGIRSKLRTFGDGARAGGQPFSRGALYALLSNPIYIGEISHKGARYPGQHAPILDREVWDDVQQLLRERAPERNGGTHPMTSPLAGKLFDDTGDRLTPSHAVKKGRRYRYYVSRRLVTGTAQETLRGWRIPAPQLEMLIAAEAAAMLADWNAIAAARDAAGIVPNGLPGMLDLADRLRERLLSAMERSGALMAVVDRIDLRADSLLLTLSLAACLVPEGANQEPTPLLTREVPLQIKRRGVEIRLIIESPTSSLTKPDPMLLKELARAHRCFDALVAGRVRSVAQLAQQENVSDRYVSSVLPLAFLPPDIIEAIVAGRQPAGLTAHRLIRGIDLPLAWPAQRQVLGVA